MDSRSPPTENSNSSHYADINADISSDEGKLPLGHKRSPSGSILSKLSLLRASADDNQTNSDGEPLSPEFFPGDDRTSPKKSSRAMAVAVQQQKTRRRKGSLRKAALLGRGAQREQKELKNFPLEAGHHTLYGTDGSLSPTSPEDPQHSSIFGLGISDAAPQPSTESYASNRNTILL